MNSSALAGVYNWIFSFLLANIDGANLTSPEVTYWQSMKALINVIPRKSWPGSSMPLIKTEGALLICRRSGSWITLRFTASCFLCSCRYVVTYIFKLFLSRMSFQISLEIVSLKIFILIAFLCFWVFKCVFKSPGRTNAKPHSLYLCDFSLSAERSSWTCSKWQMLRQLKIWSQPVSLISGKECNMEEHT